MMEFKGQVVLITGSGKGIGKAVAAEFVHEGASVCINDIILDDAEKTARELKKLGEKHWLFKLMYRKRKRSTYVQSSLRALWDDRHPCQ